MSTNDVAIPPMLESYVINHGVRDEILGPSPRHHYFSEFLLSQLQASEGFKKTRTSPSSHAREIHQSAQLQSQPLDDDDDVRCGRRWI